MSQLRRGIVVPSVFYILLLTSGFACAEPVWSTPCIWPETATQANPVDIKHMKPEELTEFETILNTIKLIHVACFNEEVYEIIHNIKTDDARDLIVAFYVYKDHDFHYVGSFGANRNVFKAEIINHNHYFVRNFYHLYIGNGRSWMIDKLIMIPHVKADIIQFCDDIHCKCEIDDFDDDCTKTRANNDVIGVNVGKVGIESKDAAVCEPLTANHEANKENNAYDAISLIKVKEDSNSDKSNKICTGNNLFKLPCICNNGNTYSNPCINKFLKPCVCPNVCPCTKLSNILGLNPCKFVSNLCPFSCKERVPSLSKDKSRFKSISERICPFNSVQKIYPPPQFSEWYNPYLYYATLNRKPNIDGNLYLEKDSTNLEKSNELCNNANININERDDNNKKYPIDMILSGENAPMDNAKKKSGNTTPNGEAAVTCNAQSNVNKPQFTVLSNQGQLLNSNENDKVIITEQPKLTDYHNPFRIAIDNGVDKFQSGSNHEEFKVDANQAPLSKMEPSVLTKLLLDKPKSLCSSDTNVYPRSKLAYLQNGDFKTTNKIQKMPKDESFSNIFVTNNNPNIPSSPIVSEAISKDVDTRFSNYEIEPLATQSPEIVPNEKKNEIECSNNVMLNITPNSLEDTKLAGQLPQILSERKYEESPIVSNIKLLPSSMGTLVIDNNKQNICIPGTSVPQAYKKEIDDSQNMYAVNNNKNIQSGQNKTPDEVITFSLPKKQVRVDPLRNYQFKLNPPEPNTNSKVLQLNNKYMNPIAKTTLATLPEYGIPNNGNRIQVNNIPNVYAKNNTPSEVLSYYLPNKQILDNEPISYELKPKVLTPNTDEGVLQLYNGDLYPKAKATFVNLPEYKTLNNEINENYNLNVQSAVPLTDGVFLTPNYIKNNDGTRLTNPLNVFAINNKIQSIENKVPNKIFSFLLPNRRVAVNPLTCHESKLNSPTTNPEMKVLELNNKHIDPKSTITFEAPKNEIDEKDNPNAQSINILTGGSLVTPKYKTDNNNRIQFNNPQYMYAINNNKIQTTQTNIPNEVSSYLLPKEQISVNPPNTYESKINLPTAKGVIKLNNDYVNPKAPTMFVKLQGFEIPNNEICEKDNINAQNIHNLTDNIFATPDYKLDNNYRMRFNDPENVHAINESKIKPTKNKTLIEALPYFLPNEQFAAKASISYQPQLNVDIPITNKEEIELSNEDMNSIATTKLVELPNIDVLENLINKNEKPNVQDISSVTGSALTMSDYETNNGDKIQPNNPHNINAVDNDKLQRAPNEISYILPKLKSAVTVDGPISYQSTLNTTPNTIMGVLQSNNEDMNPKATDIFTKIPEYETPKYKIGEQENPIVRGFETVTGGIQPQLDYTTSNVDRVELSDPQNVFTVNDKKIGSTQNNIPYDVMFDNLPEKQITVDPLISDSKPNLLTPSMKKLELNNKYMDPKALTNNVPENKIPNNEIYENVNSFSQGIDGTFTGGLLATPDCKTQLDIPQNVYAVNNNKIQGVQNSEPDKVSFYSLPYEQIVDNPISNESKLNLFTPNIDKKVLQLSYGDMNLNSEPNFGKLPEYEIPQIPIEEKDNPNIQSIDPLIGDGLISPRFTTSKSNSIQLNRPKNIYAIYNNIPNIQNNMPYEFLPSSLLKEQMAVDPSINYKSKLNLPTPITLQPNNNHINPKATTFAKLPEFEIPSNEIYENKTNIAKDIKPQTGSVHVTPDFKTSNSDRMQLNYPQNRYAVNNNKIQSMKPCKMLPYILPKEHNAVSPMISYQSKLKLPTPNILQINNKQTNPKKVFSYLVPNEQSVVNPSIYESKSNKFVNNAELSEYAIPNSGIVENMKANTESMDSVTYGLPVKPNNNNRIQYYDPQNVHKVNNNKIQINLPTEVLSYSSPNEQVLDNPPYQYKPTINQPISDTGMKILHLNNDYMNPGAPVTLDILPEYKTSNRQIDKKDNPNVQGIDTLTGNDPVKVRYKTIAYPVSKNKLQSAPNYKPNKAFSYSLPNKQILDKPSISYQSILNSPIPNARRKVLLLNNDYINPSNGYRIHLDNPQNVYVINNKIQSTENSTPTKIYSLPKERTATEAPVIYQQQSNINTLNTGNSVLQLSDEDMNPKAPITFIKLPEHEIPNYEIGEKENPDVQSMDTLIGNGLTSPGFATSNNDSQQLNDPQNVYAINNNRTQSTQNNIPNEVLSYSSPNEEIEGNPLNHYDLKLNVQTPKIGMVVPYLNNTNLKATITLAKLPKYEILNNTIDENQNSVVEGIDTQTDGVPVKPDYKTSDSAEIQLSDSQNICALNNENLQSPQNNDPNEAWSYSLPKEQIASYPQSVHAVNDDNKSITQNNTPHEMYYYSSPREENAVNLPINYEPNLYLLTPNTDIKQLQYNNENIDPTVTNKLPDYEINNSDRIQLDDPKNVNTLNNNEIQNRHSKILTFYLPKKQIGENTPVNYLSQPIVPLLNIDKGMLQLNNEDINPKETEFAKLSDKIPNNGDRIQCNDPQNPYAINNKPSKVLSLHLPNQQIVDAPCSYRSQPNVLMPNIDKKGFRLNNEDQISNSDTLTDGLFEPPDYISDNSDRKQLNNPHYAYSVNNNKIQSVQNYIPNEVFPYSLPKEQISVKPPISYQSILNQQILKPNMKLLYLNNDYINPKAKTTFAKLPNYEILDSAKIRLYHPQNVLGFDSKIQSTENGIPKQSKVLTYTSHNEPISVETPISYQTPLNAPIPNTDEEILHLNNRVVNPKPTLTLAELPEYEIPNNQIKKQHNLNVKDMDTLTFDLSETPGIETDNNDIIQLNNPQNVYAVNDSKVQSTQNNIANEVLPYSLPNEPQLTAPTKNTDKGVLESNNGEFNPITTTSFAKLTDYEILNNQIDKKKHLNEQNLDLINGYSNVNNVFRPQKFKTDIYRPVQIFSEPIHYYRRKLNPGVTYANPGETNKYTIVNIKPEKIPNYSNPIDYTPMVSGQANEIVTPKETGDDLNICQEIYTPKKFTQYEVPQEVSYKNSGRNNVPEDHFIELNRDDKLYEVTPELVPSRGNNYNLVKPVMDYEKNIQVQESNYVPLGMNADAYVTNKIKENRHSPYIHQNNDLDEDSKYIDIANKDYTTNVNLVSKDESNNEAEYAILDQAELSNPQINISNKKLETSENYNQLLFPSEKNSYIDKPSIESPSPLKISEIEEINVHNIQDIEYVNLPIPQKLTHVNQYTDDSETKIKNVYDIGLKNNKTDPLQYEIDNNLNENQNIGISDVRPTDIMNLNDSVKNIQEPNAVATETLDKPEFVNYQLADTKTNSDSEKYPIKYLESDLENNAEEKLWNMVDNSKPTLVFNMPVTEKTINDDFTKRKPITTPFETLPADILNIRADPEENLKHATKYDNENYSPTEQTPNVIADIYKNTDSPVFSSLVSNEIQSNHSDVDEGTVEQLTDIKNTPAFNDYNVFTPKINLKLSLGERNVVDDTYKISIEDYNTDDYTEHLICNPRYETETPIEGKYECVTPNINKSNNDVTPVTEIYSKFRKTDDIEICNSGSNETPNEMSPLLLNESKDNYLISSGKPIEIQANQFSDVNSLTPQVELNVDQGYMYPKNTTYFQNANTDKEGIEYVATDQGAINDKSDICPLSYNKPVLEETNNVFQDYDSKISDKSNYIDIVPPSIGTKIKEPCKQGKIYDTSIEYFDNIPRVNKEISLTYSDLIQPIENNVFNDNMTANFDYHVTPKEATANECQITGQMVEKLNVHPTPSLYTINNEKLTHWYEGIRNNNLIVCQDFNENHKICEENLNESIPLKIHLVPDKHNINNLTPTFSTLNQPGQSKININPTEEKLTSNNEIKFDENPSLTTSAEFNNLLFESTIPCTAAILPDNLNYVEIPLSRSFILPQNQWYSSLLSCQSLPSYITFKNNLNPYLSQNQPTLDSSQIPSTAQTVLKNSLLNYLKSNGNVLDNTSINIPLGNLGVAKYEPIDDTKHFTINTENDDINLKAWYSKLKLVRAKITFETAEASALNFIPIVNNKSKYCPVVIQEIAKNAISKVYGEPIVIKGYSLDEPYVIVDNVDSASIYNGGYIFLWPTLCDSGCQNSCQCWLQSFNDNS